jgi:hypothetical protein
VDHITRADQVRWIIAGTLGLVAIVLELRQIRRVKMPRATVLKTTERKDLTTLPKTDEGDGGWVELRRLSYGEKLQKDAEAMKMKFRTDEMQGGKNEGVAAEVSLISEYATLVEFRRCVMDHNLEDENGKKLNFGNPDDIRKLDPRVGDEISTLIGEMNDFQKEATTSTVDASGK